MTELRKTYPAYFASKNKIELTPAIDVDKVLREMKSRYANEKVNDADGVKIDFPENWVHLRKSNTEPIIRVYTEAKTMAEADALARAVLQVLHSPDGGTAMGLAARARALQTHDAARNATDLLHIYESILQEEHP